MLHPMAHLRNHFNFGVTLKNGISGWMLSTIPAGKTICWNMPNTFSSAPAIQIELSIFLCAGTFKSQLCSPEALCKLEWPNIDVLISFCLQQMGCVGDISFTWFIYSMCVFCSWFPICVLCYLAFLNKVNKLWKIPTVCANFSVHTECSAYVWVGVC